jgi:hypothetical protein
VIHSAFVVLIPTCQRVMKAAWPARAYHRTFWPLLAALLAGVSVLALQLGAAELVIYSTDWQISMITAAIFGATLCNAMGAFSDMGLALAWDLTTCVLAPPTMVLIIGGVSWGTMRRVGEPWPLWVGRVLAALLQLVTKAGSGLAAACDLDLARAELQV